MERFKLGFIGAGFIAKFQAQALTMVRGADLAGVTALKGAEELAAEREDKDLEKKFRELTASSVDEELEKLKAELQGGKPADPVEAELQELKSEVEKG